jgi:hypothetical protein
LLAVGDLAQRPLELARLACENQRRKAGELGFHSLEGGGKIAQVPEADLYPSRLRKLGGEWKTLGANWFVRR